MGNAILQTPYRFGDTHTHTHTHTHWRHTHTHAQTQTLIGGQLKSHALDDWLFILHFHPFFNSIVPERQPFIVDAFYFIHQENMSMKSILLESNFYIEKLGFAGVYLSFLFWLQNIDCGYSLEPPRTHNHCIVHNEEILYI